MDTRQHRVPSLDGLPDSVPQPRKTGPRYANQQTQKHCIYAKKISERVSCTYTVLHLSKRTIVSEFFSYIHISAQQ